MKTKYNLKTPKIFLNVYHSITFFERCPTILLYSLFFFYGILFQTNILQAREYPVQMVDIDQIENLNTKPDGHTWWVTNQIIDQVKDSQTQTGDIQQDLQKSCGILCKSPLFYDPAI